MGRFLPLAILSFIGLFHAYSQKHFPFIILLLSLVFVCYFLIPVLKWRLALYIVMIFLIWTIDYINIGPINLFLLLICLYIHLDTLHWLSTIAYRVFTVVNFTFLHLGLYINEQFQIEWLVLSLILLYPLLKLHALIQERHEQQHTYETLLSEFRKMKRLALESERGARLEERTKIARNIHDSVGHKLTALLMKLEMLRLQERKTEYEELKLLASESLEETRHAVRALQHEENEGIASVLQLIRQLESESHIHLDFTFKKGVLSANLSNKQNVALYRVLQESLTNAMRHAHSREVKVVLALNAIRNLEFTVENKIYEQKQLTWGFGLTNMKKRIEELNGMLNVYQQDNRFVVSGYLPLEGKEIEL
ncbi:sensor histidine kinase [Aquibacillus albus]|uniref:histidine kinase n=1 Tax=Aquibacillus albus TaxID=1168171 RepID=A0ABS2MVT2_9BACI|nr:histidine kinase [Aquibacillus albus]MBM7569950.1 signal transduction histidine kinase [Aquibacillus albus]